MNLEGSKSTAEMAFGIWLDAHPMAKRVLGEVERAGIHGRVYQVKTGGPVDRIVRELAKSGHVTFDCLPRPGERSRLTVWRKHG